MERWRKPMTAAAVEDHNERLVILADGSVFRDADVTFDEEQYARLVHGYVCAECYEPHDSPFPETCSLCGYPMRREQASKLEREFDGLKWIGPTKEMVERLMNPPEKNKSKKGSSIWVPRSVN